MTERRRLKQTESLHDRLLKFAKVARERAERMPSGAEKNAELAKAHQADSASDIDQWISSAELRRPE